MDEQSARTWLHREFDVSRETLDGLDRLAALVREENRRQNLVSAQSLEQLWWRHIADSAQLIRYAPAPSASWIDLGSGAGFPGLVVALLHRGPVTLVEERRLRGDFLLRVVARLGLQTEVMALRAERIEPRPFDVISARAFAPLPRLLAIAKRFSTAKTVLIAPKGRNAQSELEALPPSWQGDFRLVPSLTEPEAAIIVATGVRQAKRKEA